MSQKYTIQDIARIAGVGTTTVTRVLNDHPYVSEKTRQKVLKVIEEVGYRRSYAARSMRTQRSGLIGFVSDEVGTTPYAGDIIRGAQEAAWEQEKILLAVTAGHNFKLAEAAIEAMLEREVEGIIYAAMYHQVVSPPEKIRNVPVVLVDCFDRNRSFPSVVPNEYAGGFLATQHLLAAGHRRIGFINVNTLESRLPAALKRLEGYQNALTEYDVDYDESLVRYGEGSAHHGYDLGKALLQSDTPPTAIFCGNDRTAMGLYDAARELGRRVPDDLSVVGFDNQEIIATALHPALTTIQLPHYTMGQWAIKFLNDHIEAETDVEPIQWQLPCPLVERDSVRSLQH